MDGTAFDDGPLDGTPRDHLDPTQPTQTQPMHTDDSKQTQPMHSFRGPRPASPSHASPSQHLRRDALRDTPPSRETPSRETQPSRRASASPDADAEGYVGEYGVEYGVDENEGEAMASEDLASVSSKLGFALYKLGERLYACVDADHGEKRAAMHSPKTKGTLRPAVHISETCLESVRARLRAAQHGKAGALARRLLEAVRMERGDTDEDDYEGDRRAPRDDLREAVSAALDAAQRTWIRRRRDLSEKPISRNPRNWRTDALHAHRPCSRSGCDFCSTKAKVEAAQQAQLGMIQDAGPKEYWSTISATSQPALEALESRARSDAKMEMHVWRILLLVRSHDRSNGLRLYRAESLRKLLDLRLYEVLLRVLFSH
mmetsp:Transcript_5663/g.20485  ORF Transcript_5663/g.20485 Transcript_5663/m.20485 type:complete len:373 (-) Transcript_5663:117-1235(-)